MKRLSPLQISQIFLVCFLLVLSMYDSWYVSKGVYTLLRILATIISVWSAIATSNNILKLAFAFVAILFNPIIPIKLDRDEWQFIDVAVAIFYLSIILLPWLRKDPWRENQSKEQTAFSQNTDKNNNLKQHVTPATNLQAEAHNLPTVTPKENLTYKQKFLNLFRGRINRKTFLIRYMQLSLVSIAIACIMFLLSDFLQKNEDPFLTLIAFPFVFAFLFIVPLALSVFWYSNFVKRLHDINLSGWYALVLLTIQIACANVDGFVLILGSLSTLLLACFPSTKGENKYGEQPN